VLDHPDVVALRQERDELTASIRKSHGTVKNAAGTQAGRIYKQAANRLKAQTTAVERAETKRARKEHFRAKPKLELERQLRAMRGGASPAPAPSPAAVPRRHALVDRTRVADLLYRRSPTMEDRILATEALARLCGQREPQIRPRPSGQAPSGPSPSGPLFHAASSPAYLSTQCFLCFWDETLTSEIRESPYSRVSSVNRHLGRHHLQSGFHPPAQTRHVGFGSKAKIT
jgi:hypothetical protein